MEQPAMSINAGNTVKIITSKSNSAVPANSEFQPKIIKSVKRSTLNKYNNSEKTLLSRELDSGTGFTSITGYGEIVFDVSIENGFINGELTSNLSPISGLFTGAYY